VTASIKGVRCLEEGRGFRSWLFQDWAVNQNRPDSQLILLGFRFGQWARWHWGVFGKKIVEPAWWMFGWILGIEIPLKVEIGERLRLYHPNGILLNPESRIGADCHLRHGVIVGNRLDRNGKESKIPRIGNNVELGASCAILGDVEVGSHAKIGALAVVVKNVPDSAVVVGNPGRVVRIDAT